MNGYEIARALRIRTEDQAWFLSRFPDTARTRTPAQSQAGSIIICETGGP